MSKRNDVKKMYPYIWQFFDGAFSANSGGRAKVEDFDEFTTDQLERAERELSDFCGKEVSPSWLGAMADQGYTVSGQTHQELDEGADDEQHKLLAFELLDTRY